MKVCVFGAGAIGGYLGVGLANAGVDVTLVARGAHLAAMRKDGLRLQIDGEERVAPGVIRHEHGGKFPIGEPTGERSPRIERLHDMLQAAGFDAPIRADIRDEIWLKLWGNLCFNPVSALTAATIDVVATDPGTRAICLSMMREAQAIGDRIGLRLRVDAERRLAGAAALGPHKMSMLQDLERRRPMEIDALVGVVQELGRLTGLPTATVDVVLSLIRLRARSAS